MSSIVLQPFDPAFLPGLKEIFFLSSSRQTFSSPAEKEDFFQRWTSYYLEHCREQIYLAMDDNRLAGYLMGCLESAKALDHFEERLASYAVFADLFVRFPAHLHINCHPDFRGQGIGRRLIEAFQKRVRDEGLCGLHIVTSPESRNRAFYQKNGFSVEVTRSHKSFDLLFMGLPLST